MINLDTRLLDQCGESEMWLLLHITKRLGKNMFCFPSNNTLLMDTGWDIKKLREVKKSLQGKGLLEITPGKHNYSTNNYHVITDLIGVYISTDRLSSTPPSEKGTPPRKRECPPSEKRTTPPLRKRDP